MFHYVKIINRFLQQSGILENKFTKFTDFQSLSQYRFQHTDNFGYNIDTGK